ncbi:MAG: hypothetical protein HOP29_17945 [Phycisphaerales bacterium]|nr:hypothetical protein [Phycisphaerales bacterium]
MARSARTAGACVVLAVGIIAAVTSGQTRVENQADPTSAGLEPLGSSAVTDPFGGRGAAGGSIVGPISPTSFFELDRSVLDDPVLLFPEYAAGEIGFTPRPTSILRPLPGFANRPFDFSRFSLLLPRSMAGDASAAARSAQLPAPDSDDEFGFDRDPLFDLTSPANGFVNPYAMPPQPMDGVPTAGSEAARDTSSFAGESNASVGTAARPGLAPRDFTDIAGRRGDTADERTPADEALQRTLSFTRPIGNGAADAASSLDHEPGERYLRQAEEFMQSGQFLRAVAQYELAIVANRRNARAYLGQAHATLAAGQYRIAARRILAAFRQFPELIESDIDLRRDISPSSALSVCRAELHAHVERDTDYSLRFLLGYLDYFSGDASSGMDHLRAAALAAPPDSIVATLPDRLAAARARRDTGASTSPR